MTLPKIIAFVLPAIITIGGLYLTKPGKPKLAVTLCVLIIISVIVVIVLESKDIRSKNQQQKKAEAAYKQIENLNNQNEELIAGKDEVVAQNKELLGKIEKYQKTVSKKDELIEQLQTEVDKLNVTAPKLLPDGRIAASPYVTLASEFSDGINRARDLFNKGNYDEAYRIAEELKEKNPDFGLAFFLIGTIEIQRGDIDKGIKNIEHSLQLELPDEDKAWAFHNLGIVALRRKDIAKAIKYLNQAIQINPNMDESKKTLKSIEDQLGKK